MKNAVIAAAAIAMIAAPAALADHHLAGEHGGAIGAGYLGNTVVVIDPAGEEVSWQFQEDGTFASSDGLSGTYTIDGTSLCFHAVVEEDPVEFCTTSYVPDAAVGDTWTSAIGDGDGVATIRIDAGQD